ncbi:hypothetical protein [Virgibacillus salexigens]|uniref:Uncharacterized protein n=1 Tax=Virgibacillus massiliensis TaxID=1462526 RepID=A0A024QGU9_9BACI|nr:hypothetical protein [Virgibacillus massiliensis]CDQ41783.1 hypothetical protein BN990_04160 [Virgibacillus massiliensis]
MEELNNFVPKSFDEIDLVKNKLKQYKEEWLETKPGKGGGKPYMGHNTMRQILDNAVKGITYWDFGILDRWKEEVHSFNKNTNQWYFDGFVYHVRGYMYIPGVGRREQFGSKVGVGGKDNQDSAYKAATSNCFTKCASLFGVGEEIYSKIKVQEENQTDQPQSNNVYDMNQQQWGNGQQQNFNNNPQQQWGNQQQFNQQQGMYQQQQQPFPNQQMQNQQPYQNNGNFNQGQQPIVNNNSSVNQGPAVVDQQNTVQQDILEVDRMMYNNQTVETPFDNVPEQNTQQATPNAYEAEKQPQATANQNEAAKIEYGAPADDSKANETTTQQSKAGTEQWQTELAMKELQNFAEHKVRLNVKNDDEMIAYLRDYFKDEKANFDYLTPENIKEFNKYLNNVSA